MCCPRLPIHRHCVRCTPTGIPSKVEPSLCQNGQASVRFGHKSPPEAFLNPMQASSLRTLFVPVAANLRWCGLGSGDPSIPERATRQTSVCFQPRLSHCLICLPLPQGSGKRKLRKRATFQEADLYIYMTYVLHDQISNENFTTFPPMTLCGVLRTKRAC